jgi:hypothetical protein
MNWRIYRTLGVFRGILEWRGRLERRRRNDGKKHEYTGQDFFNWV